MVGILRSAQCKCRKKMNLCSGVPLAVSKEGARKGTMGGRRKGGSEKAAQEGGGSM